MSYMMLTIKINQQNDYNGIFMIIIIINSLYNP